MNTDDLIAYNREWVRIYRDNKYQREAAKRITVLCDALERAETGITHQCPPEGSSLTPCCWRSPLGLPRHDRMTVDPSQVTCQMRIESQETP